MSEGKKYYGVKEALDKTGISYRQLKLWEKSELLKIRRETNPATKNEDRKFSEDDIKQISWIKEKLKEGLPIVAIRMAVEHHTKGKISVNWYK